MIALVADERLMIQSAPTVGSEVVGELHAGDEITLAETVQSGGAAWVTVRLSGGAGGFAPGGAKFYKSRAAKLAQSSVSVLESPAAGSKVRIAYKRGDRFRLVRLPKQDWIHVWGDSGELGYIPVTTKVRVRKGFDCFCPLCDSGIACRVIHSVVRVSRKFHCRRAGRNVRPPFWCDSGWLSE